MCLCSAQSMLQQQPTRLPCPSQLLCLLLLALVMVGSLGLLQAGRGAPGQLWGSLPASMIPALGRRGSGSGGLRHCMAVISPAQLHPFEQTHTGHSPTHVLLETHAHPHPHTFHPEVAWKSRHHPSPWGRLWRAGPGHSSLPSLPPLLWCQAGPVWCGLSAAVGSCASAVDLTHTQIHTCSVCFCPCPAWSWADSATLCPRCTCRHSRR